MLADVSLRERANWFDTPSLFRSQSKGFLNELPANAPPAQMFWNIGMPDRELAFVVDRVVQERDDPILFDLQTLHAHNITFTHRSPTAEERKQSAPYRPVCS